MEAFDYAAPRTLDEALAFMANGRRVAVLAGGTDLIVQLREDRRSCDLVLDVKRIPELTAVGFGPGGTLEVGAAAPLATIYENREIAGRLPALVDAVSIIGGIQVQGRASLGGNLCNASPAADAPPALIALGATAVAASRSGRREIALEEFFRGPGQNALAPGEILVAVRIPPQPARSGAFYLRFTPRNEMDIAVVGVGARLVLNPAGDAIDSARIALGAVAPTPLLVPAAGAALAGRAPVSEAFAAAAAAAAAAARPITDMRGSAAQRKHLVRVLTIRALEGALQRARESR